MRLDDWFDEAIADQAALGQRPRPEDDKSAGRAARRRGGPPRTHRAAIHAQARTGRAPRVPELSRSTIERLETRILRAEAQAARAFESVAHILERTTAARDSDRRALIEALRRLEAITPNGAARLNPARGQRRSRGSISRLHCRRSRCAVRSSTGGRHAGGRPAGRGRVRRAARRRRTGPCSAVAGIAQRRHPSPRGKLDDLRREQAICTARRSISAPCGLRSQR